MSQHARTKVLIIIASFFLLYFTCFWDSIIVDEKNKKLFLVKKNFRNLCKIINIKIVKNLTPLFLALILVSCVVNPVPMKGTYISDRTFIIDKPLEDTWSKCIDLIASKGYGINLIDKSSGLIVTNKTDFISVFTYEDDKGGLEKPEAYVVIDGRRIIAGSEKIKVKPVSILGNWNLRVKKIDENKTSVTVNITDLKGYINAVSYAYSVQSQSVTIPAYSTGVFEKWVSEQLK